MFWPKERWSNVSEAYGLDIFQSKGEKSRSYVDDFIVKRKKDEDPIPDLKEIFESMRKHNMRLNPKKWDQVGEIPGIYGFPERNRRQSCQSPSYPGLDLAQPKLKKKVMRLTGKMVTLSRFIEKSVEKSLPFFKVLRGNKKILYEEEQKKASQESKNHLHSLPTLARHVTGEILYLYAVASQTTVSAEIVREEESVKQPIYFVSKILLDAETYAVVVAARKLKPYFDAH